MVQTTQYCCFSKHGNLSPDTSNNFLFLASYNFIGLKITANMTHNVLTCMYQKLTKKKNLN